jgi:hypothetical protein
VLLQASNATPRSQRGLRWESGISDAGTTLRSLSFRVVGCERRVGEDCLLARWAMGGRRGIAHVAHSRERRNPAPTIRHFLVVRRDLPRRLACRFGGLRRFGRDALRALTDCRLASEVQPLVREPLTARRYRTLAVGCERRARVLVEPDDQFFSRLRPCAPCPSRRQVLRGARTA